MARLCPECKRGMIFSFDKHKVCEGCLGTEHVAPNNACPSCDKLPQSKRERRAELFSPIGDDEWTLRDRTPLDEPVNLEPRSRGAVAMDHGEVSGVQSAAPSLLESEASDEDRMSECSEVPSQLRPADALLPTTGSLMQDLPSIIHGAAALKGLSVPTPSPPRPNDLAGLRYGTTTQRRPDPVWPCFPAVTALWNKAAAAPVKIKAPAASFVGITRVEGFTEKTFPSVPPLEQSLTEVFEAKPPGRTTGRSPAGATIKRCYS